MAKEEKTLGCRAPATVHTEADELVALMTEKTGKKATRTDILLLSHSYGFEAVRRHIIAGGRVKMNQTEPERITAAAADLVLRGWTAMKSDLAAIPAPAL